MSRSGVSVDVKTSRRPDARLISPVGKVIEAEVLVLAIIRGAWERSMMVTLAGWARSEDLISERRRVDPGGRLKVRCPTYVLERSDLLTSSYPFGHIRRPNVEE